MHHRRWLVHSNAVSVEGSELRWFCCTRALKQHVRISPRNDHLLDFVISDLTPSKVEVLPCVSDKTMVRAVFDLGIPDMLVEKRTAYDYSKAS